MHPFTTLLKSANGFITFLRLLTNLLVSKILKNKKEEDSVRRKKQYKVFSILSIFVLIAQTIALVFPATEIQAAERTVTLVGDLQTELGASGDWDPAAPETVMRDVGNGFYTFTGDLPAGEYKYKIAINGSWDENYGYGGENGGDIQLSLAEQTTVTVYYHDATNAIADSSWYLPVEPRVVGDLQTEINAGNDWSPSTSTAFLLDDNFDNVYSYKTMVPKGNYEYKIVLDNAWGEQYPDQNSTLNVLQDAAITFLFNADTKVVTTDYRPDGSDGTINKGKLYHNTWETPYRQPFGAVPAGEAVTLRIAAEKDDVERATVSLKNYQTGNSLVLQMDKKAWLNVDGLGNLDFWEATFVPYEKGVYGYKFIVGDQDATVEYGEDSGEGGSGTAANANVGMFQLTVFDPGYETPDWMKEAVVYQIFPDRFFNGDTSNDIAKTTARGEEPIEHREWSELPDNPRLVDQPDYNGDGIWSNDFFGGDIEGIQAKLDYLQSLGVNTLYLNPIANATSNHKYDATDYKAIDPMFGTPAEFQAFTNELASREMNLILDGVFNHVGDDSIYFDRYGKYDTVGAYEYWSRIYDYMNEAGLSEADARAKVKTELLAEGQTFSEYGFHNWFNIENEKIDVGTPTERYKYQAWWGFDSLPEIKSIPGSAVDYSSELNNEQFANYIMYDEDSVAKSWIINGGSGWRLDVANEVDPEFWREFREQLKADSFSGTGATLDSDEQPLILGEIWDDASKYFLGDQYDSVMNYRFRGALEVFLKSGGAKSAAEKLTAVQEDYPAEAYYALMNLMGSHDTPRAVFLLGGGTDSAERAELDGSYNYELGKDRLKLAAIFQMGYAGAPTIYYGDEAGITGSKDPDDRRTYPWGNEDMELVNHYQKVGAVRTAYSDLFAYGNVQHVYAEGDVLAYVRSNDEQAALVVINRGSTAANITIDVSDILPNGTNFVDQLDTTYTAAIDNGAMTLSVPALDGRMLVADRLSETPTSIQNLQVVANEGAVEVSWNGSASEYAVYKTNLSGAFYELVNTTSSTSMTVNGLENGREYYFAVAALDENGNESTLVESAAVVPAYDLSTGWTGNLTQLQNEELDLTKWYDIYGELWLDGVTNIEQAEGVTAKLQVKSEADIKWTDLPAVYVGQSGNNNQFKGVFAPFATGTYEYRMAFTSDLGSTWTYTETTNTVMFTQGADTSPPADRITLEQPAVESGMVNLNWTVSNLDENDAYIYEIIRDGKSVRKMTTITAETFRDSNLQNGTTYSYQVRLNDKAGNAVESNVVTVTPDIIMVEVTFKVNAPDYTPLTANLTIPNSLNGWNSGAWEMSRNGAVTPDWEYTTEVQEGTEITYKYVKGGSWDQEGLADHTPYDSTDDDISYYGFGAPGTDLKVVVTNEGNNKMVIEDKIIRWIDMPIVFNPYPEETDQDTVVISGNAIKEGVLTINGERVTVADDMKFSREVELMNGVNEIAVHIEPSDENKSAIFNGDGGAIAKNTRDYTLTVIANLETIEDKVEQTIAGVLTGDVAVEDAATQFIDVVKAGDLTSADIKDLLLAQAIGDNDETKTVGKDRAIITAAEKIERSLEKMLEDIEKGNKSEGLPEKIAHKQVSQALEKIKQEFAKK